MNNEKMNNENIFTKVRIEELKAIFDKSDFLEQQLINGDITEDEFIDLMKKLKFDISDKKKREYINNVWSRHERGEETEEEFKERVIGKLTELGFGTITMRKRL